MRITGGQYSGRTISLPKGPGIRPTQDQVRQALFNILADRMEGARVLDLFAGSGALGLEALSRGAARVTFVDRSVFCIRAIGKNLEALGIPADRADLLREDAIAAIPQLKRRYEPFDLVLADPPYEGDLARKTLSALCCCAIVSPTGWVVAEHAKRDPLPPEFEGSAGKIMMQRIELYGDTAITFYN